MKKKGWWARWDDIYLFNKFVKVRPVHNWKFSSRVWASSFSEKLSLRFHYRYSCYMMTSKIANLFISVKFSSDDIFDSLCTMYASEDKYNSRLRTELLYTSPPVCMSYLGYKQHEEVTITDYDNPCFRFGVGVWGYGWLYLSDRHCLWCKHTYYELIYILYDAIFSNNLV